MAIRGNTPVIEGDHGSAYFYPDSDAAHIAMQCQVELQRRAGGNAMIGRELDLLLREAGFNSINVSPRRVYVDSSKLDLVEGFTKNTFTAMIKGIRNVALKAGIVDENVFDKGIQDLYRTAEDDGVFCYTFFKAVAPVLLGPNVFGIFSVLENQFYLDPNIANRLTRLVPGHY